MPGRKKISTTVDARTYAYLQELISHGRARNLSEALDLSVRGQRRLEMRRRLERDTAAYFGALSPEATAKEASIEAAADQESAGIDFDTA